MPLASLRGCDYLMQTGSRREYTDVGMGTVAHVNGMAVGLRCGSRRGVREMDSRGGSGRRVPLLCGRATVMHVGHLRFDAIEAEGEE